MTLHNLFSYINIQIFKGYESQLITENVTQHIFFWQYKIFSSSRKLWLNGKNACIKFVWPSWPQTLFNLWTSYNLVRHLISHTPIMLLVTGNDFTSMFFLQKEIMGFFYNTLTTIFQLSCSRQSVLWLEETRVSKKNHRLSPVII